MLSNLAKLISVKKIIALALTGAFIFLTVKGGISETQFMTIFSLIITFYYAQSVVGETTSNLLETTQNNTDTQVSEDDNTTDE